MQCFAFSGRRLQIAVVLFAVVGWFSAAWCAAQTPKPAVASKKSAASPAKKFPDFDTVVKGAKRLEGLFPLHFNEKEQKLYMEIKKSQYDKELICPIAIARGSGMFFLGGDTLNFGDQWVLSFRRAADKILVVRRNVRYRAKAGSPEADAVKTSYTDSIIKALPIKSEKSGGQTVLVDLADLFMTDLARIGASPDRSRSTWAKVKAFPKNIEIEVAAVFSSGFGGLFSLLGGDASPDPRGTQVVIHYGLSMLPSDGYKPRLADDRVGYFLSTMEDYSTDVHQEARLRYVRRWRLEKDDAQAEKSAPKEPLIFWIEKTVPRKYRPYVREGILEWNKAFEKVGLINAIQVRDQQSSDDFDPEDLRYNTFRWIATSAGFAMGPSRANPKTGQILDADIVFDEGLIRSWRQEYLRTSGVPQALDLLARGQRQAFFKLYSSQLPLYAHASPVLHDLLKRHRSQISGSLAPGQAAHQQTAFQQSLDRRGRLGCECCLMGPGIQHQLSLGAVLLAAKGDAPPGGKVPEELINQAVKHVVMHEVGHTLGLRHNFKASTMLSLKDINNPEITKKKGMVGSVMDYAAANYVPKGEQQGQYFSTTLGPYDYWAIEYAYKPISGDEQAELKKIASKVALPEHAYGTDEDLYSNPDPRINVWDLGDPLEYSEQRMRLVKAALKDLATRVVAKGEGWQRARTAFNMLLGEVSSATYMSAQYIGGEYTHRDHRGDPKARLPMEPIPVEKQRKAIRFLQEQILSDKAFEFSPELLKRLAPPHWGDGDLIFFSSNYQTPIYDEVLSIQRVVISRFLSADVLRAIQEIELHAGAGQQALKLPEVFDALTSSIWSELPSAKDEPAKGKAQISTIRRNLQREHYQRLAQMVLGQQGGSFADLVFFSSSASMPADARSLARSHLRQIKTRIDKALGAEMEVDAYSRAHLEEVRDRIDRVMKASLNLRAP